MGKIRKNKKGTTMVEVLVAFLVVMLMMALFSRVVIASIHLFERSGEEITKTETFDEKYYQIAEREKRAALEGGTLVLVLDEEKTSVDNTIQRRVNLILPKGVLSKYSDEESGLYRYSVQVIGEAESESEGE